MPRTVAGRRGDMPEPERPAVRRNYPISGPLTQEEVVQWLLAKCPDWPRWRAVSATAIAVAMRSNSEPVPGGLVTIRVHPQGGGFQIEDRSGKG